MSPVEILKPNKNKRLYRLKRKKEKKLNGSDGRGSEINLGASDGE